MWPAPLTLDSPGCTARVMNASGILPRIVLVVLACALGCGGPPESDGKPTNSRPSTTAAETNTTTDTEPQPCSTAITETRSLKETFASHFRVGTAIPPLMFISNSQSLIGNHFNHLSPENLLKWSSLQREPGVYTFADADQFVEFGEQQGMTIYGHVLVWHQQVPGWVFDAERRLENPSVNVTREELLRRLEEHVSALAVRYGGRIAYWDVVNEAFQDDGSLRDTPWRQILGDDYIATVFELASRLLPDTKLVYNDYSLVNAAKRAGAMAVVKDLQQRGIRIDAIGEQGHYNMTYPAAADLKRMFDDFRTLGVEVLITELDVDVLPSATPRQGADLDDSEEYQQEFNPFTECLPAAMDAQLSARWETIFTALTANADIIEAVTFWGVSDEYSWLNNWPVQGRTNYPLLFNRDLSAKSALKSVLDTANPL
jgi:endo-1,4-beta-xylanase